MTDRHHIVVSSATYNALKNLAKYRETMDDVVLKAIVVYSLSLNMHFYPQAISNILDEHDKRFGKPNKDGE